MSKIGYVRVSAADQKTDRQEIALKEFSVDKCFTEKASGKNTDRAQLKKMLEYVREGDTVYIESISRLARSTKDLLNIVQQLQEKSVDLVSLKGVPASKSGKHTLRNEKSKYSVFRIR